MKTTNPNRKLRQTTIIHVDPHFSRTSALADIWVPIRAGADFERQP
jgi:formate dehydrogenase major subunit